MDSSGGAGSVEPAVLFAVVAPLLVLLAYVVQFSFCLFIVHYLASLPGFRKVFKIYYDVSSIVCRLRETNDQVCFLSWRGLFFALEPRSYSMLKIERHLQFIETNLETTFIAVAGHELGRVFDPIQDGMRESEQSAIRMEIDQFLWSTLSSGDVPGQLCVL